MVTLSEVDTLTSFVIFLILNIRGSQNSLVKYLILFRCSLVRSTENVFYTLMSYFFLVMVVPLLVICLIMSFALDILSS